VLVTEDELRTLVLDMYARRPQAVTLAFEPPKLPEPERTCPSCTTQMTKHTLYGIQVDRCSEHGVWFDKDELRAVLAEVGAEHGASMSTGEKFAGAGIIMGIYVTLGLIRLLL